MVKSQTVWCFAIILLLICPAYAAVQQNGQEPAPAIRNLIEAANRGDAQSQCDLAIAYLEGRDVDKSYTEAAKWFDTAAEQGLAEAQFHLGLMYSDGQGVDRDYKKAAKWIRKAAEQDHAEAQFRLSFMYSSSRGVSWNQGEAMKWLLKAAEQGDAEAQFHLAMKYGYGEGIVNQDTKRAAKWFCAAAEQADAHTQYLLGLRFLQGSGVSQDNEETAKWFRKAAEQDHAEAQFNLALLYVHGDGVIQNYAEAAKWLNKAAEQGNTSAPCMLGALYGEGRGVAQDFVQAYMWLNLCTNTAKGKKQETAAKYLEEIVKHMKPQQIEEAHKMARDRKSVQMPRLDLIPVANLKTPSGITGRGPTPYAVGDEVKNPEVLYKPKPHYTAEARKARIKGIVRIGVTVRKDGRVDNPKILSGLGYGLDESALYSIRTKWRFKPSTRNGVPMDIMAVVDVTFRIY